MDISRRDIFTVGGKLLILASVGATLKQITGAEPPSDAYRMADHWWGMIVDIDKCIGCGNCVRACSKENNVPEGYFRTWVERYQIENQIKEARQPHVESPNGAIDGFPPLARTDMKSFFVPKLCNHCADSPCVQVCPVGATFVSPDGVVLVDKEYCLGCRYCVQACPYGCPRRVGVGEKGIRPGLPLLRAGLPLRLPLSEARNRNRGQVHPLLPPHYQGFDHGLLRELPHRRAAVSGFQGPQGSGTRIPAR